MKCCCPSWKPNDTDTEHNSPEEMVQGQLPAEEHQPDQIEHQLQHARIVVLLQFFAKGHEGGQSKFDGLDSKRNAHDRQAECKPTEDQADRREEATKNGARSDSQ